MGETFRIVLFMIQFIGIATILALNLYADCKDQILITPIIFVIAYIIGLIRFKTEFKPNWQILTLLASVLLISIYAYGFGMIYLLKQFEWGAVFVQDIATYQIIPETVLNVISGIIISIIGFFFGVLDLEERE